MKIRLKNPEGSAEVFAVYWYDQRTMFLGLTEQNRGLLVFDSNEVEVIDSTLSGSFTYYDNNLKGIYHSALIEENLLDGLLEYEEGAYKRLMEILGRA